MISPETSFIVV